MLSIMEINIWCAITLNQNTRALKVALEGAQLVDKKKRIFKLNETETAVPLKPNVHTTKSLLQLAEKIPARIECITVTHKQSRVSPRETLIIQLKELFNKCDLKWNEELVNEIPKHWEHHGDLILIPENSFTSEIWCCIGEKLWTTVASALGFKRLAKMSVIKNNDFRSPKVKLLVGQDGWVTHVDNGIKYTFDVTKCMFSSGNISEKIRIGKLNCSGQVIVDLYAGIGYFVLPYLVHAKAAMVHACEWNPDAVEALQRTLRLNDVDAKCKVYAGDNRKFPHKGIADHVNLGLIPSSEAGWPTACRALRPDVGGWLHVHGNVTSSSRRKSRNSPATLKEDDMMLISSDNSIVSNCSKEEWSIDHSIPFRNDLEESPYPVVEEQEEMNICESLKKDFCKISKNQNEFTKDPHVLHTMNTNEFDLESSNSSQDHTCAPFSIASPTQTLNNKSQRLPSCNKSLKPEWLSWSDYVVSQIKIFLSRENAVSDWLVIPHHIEHVKSYAPHIDHLVLDIECRPAMSS